MVQTELTLISDRLAQISALPSTLWHEVSEYNKTVLAVRNEAKVECYWLVRVNNLNHTVLNRSSLQCISIVNLQSVTKVYLCPVSAERIFCIAQIIDSTVSTIKTILCVTIIVALSLSTCCELLGVDLELEVYLATHYWVVELNILLT